MIRITKIFGINGKRIEPITVSIKFADHSELEKFRAEFKQVQQLTEVRFQYEDTEPKVCKCGRQMVYDVVKNKYVCECN